MPHRTTVRIKWSCPHKASGSVSATKQTLKNVSYSYHHHYYHNYNWYYSPLPSLLWLLLYNSCLFLSLRDTIGYATQAEQHIRFWTIPVSQEFCIFRTKYTDLNFSLTSQSIVILHQTPKMRNVWAQNPRERFPDWKGSSARSANPTAPQQRGLLETHLTRWWRR